MTPRRLTLAALTLAVLPAAVQASPAATGAYFTNTGNVRIPYSCQQDFQPRYWLQPGHRTSEHCATGANLQIRNTSSAWITVCHWNIAGEQAVVFRGRGTWDYDYGISTCERVPS